MTPRKKKKAKGSQSKAYVFLVILCCGLFSYVWPKIEDKLESNNDVESEYAENSDNASFGTDESTGNSSESSNSSTGFKQSSPAYELPAQLTDRNEQILEHVGYTTSYNKSLRLPNWVAWQLTAERLVEVVSRSNKFLPDPLLPEEEAVTTKDYSGSGYDRGHMCPAGDNRWRLQAMTESFYMTNMCPQTHNLNAGDWKELEDKCREWAKSEGRIYIVCGPILYNQEHKTIGDHKVTVPEAFYKVILAMGKTPKAIGFIYKNATGNNPLSYYVNSVDEVERITGIDFFPSLPDEIENKVEASYDLNLWK